jgi:hypothetical protein
MALAKPMGRYISPKLWLWLKRYGVIYLPYCGSGHREDAAIMGVPWHWPEQCDGICAEGGVLLFSAYQGAGRSDMAKCLIRTIGPAGVVWQDVL